jgi:hypothetical protein
MEINTYVSYMSRVRGLGALYIIEIICTKVYIDSSQKATILGKRLSYNDCFEPSPFIFGN